MMIIRRFICIGIALLAVACSPEDPANPGGEVSKRDSTASQTATSDNGMLTVTPAIIDLCDVPEGIIAADVTWDISSTGAQGSQVWLESAEHGRKLWSQAGAAFSSRTGVWLRDGSKIILVGEAGTELAQVQIKSKPCSE